MDGYELILEIRKKDKDIPITIVSNHDDKEKLQKCIPLGLSGYLFKPINYQSIKEYLEEFSTNIQNLSNTLFELNSNTMFDISNKCLYIDGTEHLLTKLEVEFLELICKTKNKILTYDMIFESMYFYNPSHNTIKNLVYRLKKKYNISNIQNIRDIGYQLN